MPDTEVVHDSLPDDTYRVSAYTRHLTDNTPVWQWGAFEFGDMSLFAPVGTLGERRDFVATQLYAQIKGWK